MAGNLIRTSKCFIEKVAEGKEGSDGVPSVGPTYRSIFAKYLYPKPEDINSSWDLFCHAVKKFPSNDMLGKRKIVDGKAAEYVFETYQEVYDKVINFGSAMRTVGVQPTGGRCGIYGPNSPEWFITMEACNAHGIYCVPLYDSLGEGAVDYIVNHSEVSIVFVQEAKIPLLLHSLSKPQNPVKTVVSFTTFTSEQKSSIEGFGMAAYSWEEFQELGRQNPVEVVPPKGNDICTIMYTSGTTGDPKGVLISNECVVHVVVNLADCLRIIEIKFGEEDSFLSYLPLAHVLDRVAEEFMVFVGAKIGYWQGNPLELLDDVKELKPTLFVGVPRIFERIYTGFHQKIEKAGCVSQILFNYAYQTKLQNLKKGIPMVKAAPLCDKLVFNKVKQAFGGQVRVVLSGAAPLSPDLEEFLRTTLCSPVLQGYGLTETGAGSFLALPDVMSMMGTVGPPLPCIDTRLESIPDMNYDALGTPGRGEILIAGKSLFSGYYKQEELTKEVLVDGWFHTGDVGEWQPDGSMKIIDRKKNIFKLAQGEYVAVEKLETAYSQASVVETIWVYGNSLEATLVAVVVPSKPVLESWASSNGVEGDFKEICQDPRARDYVLKELSAVQKKNKLKGFEAIKAVHLEPVPFGMDRDLVSPTFKIKRPQLLRYYKTVIDELYKGLKSQKS